MEQGILERIESKLDLLLSRETSATLVEPAVKNVSAVSPAPTVEIAPVLSVSPTAPVTPVVTSSAPAADVELDVEGQPWDERIHTKAKSKTVKQVWKLLRGVDKDVVEQVKAENKAKYATAAPTAPVAPVAPVAPTAPTAPVAPVAPTAPAADPYAVHKANAIAELNKLSQQFNVDADDALEVVETFGVKLFSDLKPEQYEQVWVKYKAWVDFLQLCQAEVDKIVEMFGDSGQAAVVAICQQKGVDHIGGVHHEEVNQLHDSLKLYREKCEAAYAG